MKESLRKNWDEFCIIVGLIVIATLFIVLIDAQQELNPVDPGASAFPILVGIFTIALCGIQLISLFRKRTEEKDEGGKNTRDTKKSRQTKAFSIILAIALTAGYIYLFELINYIILTGLFVMAVMFVMGVRKWTILVSVSIIYAVISFYVYGEFLNVPL
jgi:lysylphosphatidylglycerol synthetase-like protein (DUF2156 family)